MPATLHLHAGLKAEMHGLLGNRGPEEQLYSSLLSVSRALGVPTTMIGTPWFIDLVRSEIVLGGDGSVTASHSEFETFEDTADEVDAQREEALLLALKTPARLVLSQFSQVVATPYARHDRTQSNISPRCALELVRMDVLLRPAVACS